MASGRHGDAVPARSGAHHHGINVGTTVTSTLVALGFVGDREEFRRALAGLHRPGFFFRAVDNKRLVLAYLVGVFIALPAAVIAASAVF